MAKINLQLSLATVGISFVWIVTFSAAAEPNPDNRKSDNKKAESTGPSLLPILREASDLALEQDKSQHYWIERVLLHIAELQIQAADFDGALRSIRGSATGWHGNRGLMNLATSLARAGKRERAFEILFLIEKDPWWPADVLGDRVELEWIKHLIASGNLADAKQAIGVLKLTYYRPDALAHLAVANAKLNNGAQAKELFTQAVDAASSLKDEPECAAEALQKIADAQLTVRLNDNARETIRRLAETADLIKDPWAKASALWKAAVVVAKANDHPTAHRLFDRAIEAQKTPNGKDNGDALREIAAAQASVGYLDDALKTVKQNKRHFEHGDREAVLLEIAAGQAKMNDVEGAVRTALSVKRYLQYRDDSLHMIVDHLIAKRDFKTALTTAQEVANPSRQAAAILKVATAHAKSGDRKTATQVAAQIELIQSDDLPVLLGKQKQKFDYRHPRTWGVRYDDHSFFTGASHHFSTQRAAEVAAAAMELSLALGQQLDQSYAILFNEINTPEVVQVLARTHAASGNSGEALAWAKKIGSSGKVDSNDNSSEKLWAVERRIHALIGVAEGILDLLKKGEF